MHRLFLAIVFSCFCLPVVAQLKDSLFVVTKDNRWYVRHVVKHGEDIFLLSRRFHVPPARLADANAINYQALLREKQLLYIPLGDYNKLNFKPGSQTVRDLYYRVGGSDNLQSISRVAGVQQ